MRGRRSLAWLVLLLASLAVAAWAGGGVIDRIAHPGRYATSGSARLGPAAYVAAARRVMAADDRIASVTLPLAAEPVVVSASSTIIYLDPPTARVLDVARRPVDEAARPIDGAQPVARVIERARPYGGGGAVRRIDWPTERHPDWTIGFAEGDAAVKVADDSGSARPAPARPAGSAMTLIGRYRGDGPRFAWRLAIFLAAIGAAMTALAAIARGARRRRPSSTPVRIKAPR